MEKEKSVLTIARQFFGYLLDGMISLYMLLIIVVLPFYNELGFGHIGTDKAMFFRKISVYAVMGIVPTLVILLILRATEKGYLTRIRKVFWEKTSVTDWFAVLYLISVILSYACSGYKENALWGARGWYMGFFTQLIFLAIYFMVSMLWEPKKWLFLLIFPVSAAVFLLGYLNRFDIYPIDMKSTNPNFISTIGNINWYCGYLVSVFFAGCYLLWHGDRQGSLQEHDEKQMKKQNRESMLKNCAITAYVALGFATLVTQGSMSGLLALAVVMLTMFCFSVKDGERMQKFWQETFILSLACTFTLGIRVLFPGKMTFIDPIVDILTYSAFPLSALLVSLVFWSVTAQYNAKGTYYKSPLNKLFQKLAKIMVIGVGVGTVVIIGMIALNTTHPGSLGKLSEISFFTFNADWGSNRGAMGGRLEMFSGTKFLT